MSEDTPRAADVVDGELQGSAYVSAEPAVEEVPAEEQAEAAAPEVVAAEEESTSSEVASEQAAD